MYLIINSEDLIVEIASGACYVRRQPNGVVTLSDKDSAEAIYSNDSDKFYPVENDEWGNYLLVTIDTVPSSVVAGYYYYHAGEFYTTEKNLNALAKAEAPTLASIVFVSLAKEGKLDDTTITEHARQFPGWTFPVEYAQSTICQWRGKVYRCLQAHTSQEDWPPESSISLWKEIGNPDAEWPSWSQPVGAVDTYVIGDRVSHNDKHWISTRSDNVWEPGIFGWEELTSSTEKPT